MTPSKFYTPEQLHEFRKQIDALIQFSEKEQENGQSEITPEQWELHNMAAYQAHVHLINAKMWVGKMLEGLGTPFPKELADKAE